MAALSEDKSSAPVIFCKPNDAVIDVTIQDVIPYPPHTRNLHYEIELIVAIGIVSEKQQ